MTAIQIVDSCSKHNIILSNIRETFSTLVRVRGVKVTSIDEEVRIATNELNRINYRDLKGNYQIPKDDPIDYKYQFWITEDNGLFYIWSHRIGKTKADFKEERSISKPEYLLRDFVEERELIAYEMFKTYYSLTEDESKRLSDLQQKEKKRISHYTLMSFLPPVNQFQSHTSKGTANGIAIVSGYAISIGGFIWSTASYNINKRRYDAVSVDLSEADKARAYYKGNMDLCRGGQIASVVLFAGTYIYGVVNALSNRSNYQGNRQITLAPIAYDNGGGIALVYGF